MLDQPQQRLIGQGLRAGDRAAWAALYDGYVADVWKFAARLIGGDPAAVDDVVQETFLSAARSAGGFDPERGTLWVWLTGIAQRQVALYWRQSARADRVRRLAISGAGEIQEWLNDTSEPETPWERHESADLIRGVLAELNPTYAGLLTSRYLDQRSIAEMIELFGGSHDSLKSKLARARCAFREKFVLLHRG
ncbi:MAG: sigma-70 family RNA polymerase sigma factor [Pirellulales bacterium]